MSWIFDMTAIPKGEVVERPGPKGSVRKVHVPDLVIIAAPDGETVTVSRWIPDENRWNMIGKNEQPVAWMPFPKHPHGPDGETK